MSYPIPLPTDIGLSCWLYIRLKFDKISKLHCFPSLHRVNSSWPSDVTWGLWCQKQLFEAGINNHIPRNTVGCTCPCLRYLLLAPKSSYGNIELGQRWPRYWLVPWQHNYLKRFWLLISEVLWYSPGGNCAASVLATILYNEYEKYNFKITDTSPWANYLTHWGRVTHICVSELIILGSDNGLSPGWRQAIIWSNAGILSIGTLGTNFSEILIEILTFSFKNMRLKVSSGKWRPSCLGLNVLNLYAGMACYDMYVIYVWHFVWYSFDFSWHHGICIQHTGARLTKAYDVTIQRYRNLHAKIEDSKMHILRCMGSKFCVKFQRYPLKFHTKFSTHTTQNMHFMRC